jgi:hypothetical protein
MPHFTCQSCFKICKSSRGLAHHISTIHGMVARAEEPEALSRTEETEILPRTESVSEEPNPVDINNMEVDNLESEISFSTHVSSSSMSYSMDDADNDSGDNFVAPRIELCESDELSDSIDDSEQESDLDSDTITISEDFENVSEHSEEEPVSKIVLRNEQGGWIIDSLEASNKWNEFAREINYFHDKQSKNPYFPWRGPEELWVTDFLYRRAHLSTQLSNELLQNLGNDNVKRPIQFRNVRELYDILDIAASSEIVSI